MTTPILISIQVGQPAQHGVPGAPDPLARPFISGIFKSPVPGPVRVTRTNLDGDGQADLENHGGVDKAILAYAADHYPAWRAELSLPDLPYGGFGENFTIAGQSEADVCLGDIYEIGEVRFEVSQPRLPCWKLARRWRLKDLTARVERNGHAGWYLRVLKEGVVKAGLAVRRIERPHPDWTVARAYRLMLHDKDNRADAAALAALPPLSANWKAALGRRLAAG